MTTFEVGEKVVIKNQTFEVAAVVEGGALFKPVPMIISANLTENDS
jgi:hypothetical protein